MGKADLLVLFVRIHLKTEAERFFRCGIEFGRGWKEVEVDAATAQRLQEEQMLEVSETQPGEASAPAAPVAPTDPAERAAAIKVAIAQLDETNTTLWKADGAPTAAAIEALTGWPVSAAERDAVWAEIKAV